MSSSEYVEFQNSAGASRSVGRHWQFGILLLCTLAGGGQIVLLASNVPLGIVNEWVWPRFELQFEPLQIILLFFAVLITCGLLRLSLRPTESVTFEFTWVLGVLLCGVLWINAAWSVMPEMNGQVRSVYVLFYPRTSGYYWQAKYEVANIGEFLSDYQQSIEDQSNPDNYLHIGTHPPGLTISHRILLNLCHASPQLVRALESLQPSSVRDAFAFLTQANRQQSAAIDQADLSALWLAVLLSQLIGVCAVVPLYALAREFCTKPAARIISVLWLFVPAVLVFLPKSDAVFPCLACGIQWLWFKALQKNSPVLGALTAVVLIASAMLSLAFMTVGVILGLQLVHQQYTQRNVLRPFLGGLIVGVIILAATYSLTDLNLPGIWLQNFRNHAAFYDHNARSYFDWLGANIVEVCCALGGPFAVLAIAGTIHLLRRCRDQSDFAVLSGLAVWGLLWMSGKNMGEAARLWIFLMPYAAWAAAVCIDQMLSSQRADRPHHKQSRRFAVPFSLLWVVCLQVVVCFFAMLVVDGFGFTQL